MSVKQRDPQFLKGLKSYRVPDDLTSSAVCSFLESLDCPRSLAVWLLYKYGEHEQLVDLTVNPLDYQRNSFRDAYIATEFLSKSKFLKLDRDLDKVALDKFDEFEELCKCTNNRFRYPLSDQLKTPVTVWLHNAVTRKIERILGDFDLQDVITQANWGPGASTLIKRRDASSPAKFQYETGITRDLFYFVNQPMSLWYPGWVKELAGREVSFQVGNKIVTVPKNAKTNRVIAIEPGLNLWFQLGVGNAIGMRLRRCGIDLRDQSSNQKLALKASVDGSLATVDCTSASDSIARAVVEELLPPQWFEFMDICRSHFGMHGDQYKKSEKFSSMGNGFTFQLESLIFYAIAFCCAEYEGCDTSGVSVYGDDIIIPVGARAAFLEMMTYYGFRINPKKSFFTTPFRESCGSHYFEGQDCKPLYLKDRLQSVSAIYRHANGVRRLASRSQWYGCDSRFEHCFHQLKQAVPRALRLVIPESLGDGGFIGNFDEATPHVKVARSIPKYQQWEGYFVNHLVETAHVSDVQYPGLLLARLWDLDKGPEILDPRKPTKLRPQRFARSFWQTANLRPDTLSTGNQVPKKGVTRLKVVRSLVVQWDELGPWI